MKCPTCGAAELAHEVRDMLYTYKTESTVIHSVAGSYCAICGEGVLEVNESSRVSAAMQAFKSQVNSSIVGPAFIPTPGD